MKSVNDDAVACAEAFLDHPLVALPRRRLNVAYLHLVAIAFQAGKMRIDLKREFIAHSFNCISTNCGIE